MSRYIVYCNGVMVGTVGATSAVLAVRTYKESTWIPGFYTAKLA